MANGFRNDCEERWACFFTEMGWLWEYRPDEYVRADDGLCYAPTFMVETDDGHYNFEVREHDTDDISTVEWFCAETGGEVILVTGNPVSYEYNWVAINSWSDLAEHGRYDRCVWDGSQRCIRYEFYSGEFDIVPVALFVGARFIEAVTVSVYQYICESGAA